MDLLAYWRWSAYQRGMADGPLYHFNSDRPRLHKAVGIGDRLWLVLGRPEDGGTDYVLAARLDIVEKRRNTPGYEFGAYRLRGNPTTSQYYAADGPDMTDLLLRLRFNPAKPISVAAKKDIAMALRSLRSLSPGDSELMAQWAKGLVLVS